MIESTGNVFEDLGFGKTEAANLLIRAKLIIQISDLIKKRGLKQAEAAKLLGVKQPDISALMQRKIEKFTIDRLVNFLSSLNQQVEIKTRPRKNKRANSDNNHSIHV